MSFDIRVPLNHFESHALSSGLFDIVNLFESTEAQNTRLSIDIWIQRVLPYPAGSGLNMSSARIEFGHRIYSSQDTEPRANIDPNVYDATHYLFEVYSKDFNFGTVEDQVKGIDLMGESGDPLSAEAGYWQQQGQTLRVMEMLVPLIVNDMWRQEA